MVGLNWRLITILTLFLFASSSFFAKTAKRQSYDSRTQVRDAVMPQEVLSAKTIALVVKVIGGTDSNVAEYKQRIEASAAAEIQKRNRFQLVSDPAKADLVCVLMEFSYDYWHDAYQPGKGFLGKMHGRTWNTMPPGIIFVLKGGNDPHRTAQPVWMKTRIMGVSTAFKVGMNKIPTWMMKDFHQAFARAEKKHAPDSTQDESSEQEADLGIITGPATMPQVSRAEQLNPVFCKLNQPCHLPRELFSAHKVLVCDPIYFCNDKNIQSDVAWGGRWTLAPEPALADLIIVLCRTPSNSSDRTAFIYTGLYIFKGGEQPDWDSMPIYLQFGYDHEVVLKQLEKMVVEAH